jgi:23S rRNA (cytidine1920-2'-O)/16S rRNA (cytidine1409-2'-O)-methyltransferase
MPKIRLDQYLLQRGLAENIGQAQSFCVQGLVHDANQKLLKAGMLVNEDRTDIKLKTLKSHNYVARSALKLKAATNHYQIAIAGKICADIGCSTGGFTEVLLENDAKLVYAVDVAYGEFATKLRNDPRVILLERTNAKNLNSELIPATLDIIVCDVSFISLKSALPACLELLKAGGILVALVKPQFELPKNKVEEGGIIKDSALHKEACDAISNWLAHEKNFNILGILPSPILGVKGNQEFLLYATKN